MYLKRFENLYRVERIRIPDYESGPWRLHRNEKPDNWPQEFLDDIFGAVPADLLQRYPNHEEFRRKLSELIGVPENRFVVTSGMDEPIRTLLMLCCAPGDLYATPWPGYGMYPVFGRMLGAEMTEIVYDPRSFMDATGLTARIPEGARLLFLPNPNQPVENCFDVDQLREIAVFCRSRDILMAVDEAYHYFGAPSAIPLTEEFDNVLVMRTFSKALGAASLRLGYVVGSEAGIKPLAAFRLSHESNAFSYHVGSALLDRFEDIVKPRIDAICAGRDRFRQLCRDYGLEAWGKVANFVLVDLETKDRVDKVREGLADRSILIRGPLSEPLDHYLMVTSGPVALMERVFVDIREILES